MTGVASPVARNATTAAATGMLTRPFWALLREDANGMAVTGTLQAKVYMRDRLGPLLSSPDVFDKTAVTQDSWR